MTAEDEDDFDARFARRTKAYRQASGLTQRQVADVLGVNIGTYKKWEQRSPMRHRFVGRFCIVVHCTQEDLFAVDKPLPRKKSQRRAS